MARKPPPTYELDPQQLQALDLLLTGKSITETAAAVGVDRTTVSRWKQKDAAFVAAFNQTMLTSWEGLQKRQLDARTKALDKLVTLLDHEDPAVSLKAATALARLETLKPTGQTDPERMSSYLY